jgi:hypothetical protein
VFSLCLISNVWATKRLLDGGDDDDGAPPPPVAQRMKICYNHPTIHAQLNEDITRARYNYPAGHVSLQAYFAPMMPSDHDNVDVLLANREMYESDHPNVDNYVNRVAANQVCQDYTSVRYPASGQCPATVPSWHPVLDASINSAGSSYPTSHVKTHPIMASWMPPTHRLTSFVLICASHWPLLAQEHRCINVSKSSSSPWAPQH